MKKHRGFLGAVHPHSRFSRILIHIFVKDQRVFRMVVGSSVWNRAEWNHAAVSWFRQCAAPRWRVHAMRWLFSLLFFFSSFFFLFSARFSAAQRPRHALCNASASRGVVLSLLAQYRGDHAARMIHVPATRPRFSLLVCTRVTLVLALFRQPIQFVRRPRVLFSFPRRSQQPEVGRVFGSVQQYSTNSGVSHAPMINSSNYLTDSFHLCWLFTEESSVISEIDFE